MSNVGSTRPARTRRARFASELGVLGPLIALALLVVLGVVAQRQFPDATAI